MFKSFLNRLKLSKKLSLGIAGFLLVGALVGVYFYTSKKKTDADGPFYSSVNPAFTGYISAYSAGVLSKASAIQIRLANPIPENSFEGNLTKLFDFEPEIKGSAVWVDNQTIEFTPASYLKPGQLYTVNFDISSLIKDLPDELEVFSYQFQVMSQNYEVQLNGLRPYEGNDLKRQKLEGTLLTADISSPEEVEKVISAMQHNSQLKINWKHEQDKKTHFFTVEEIARQEKASKVTVKWKGDAMAVDYADEKDVEVPALGDFKLMDAKVVQSPEQYISLLFSDPLKINQNLHGLIYTNEHSNFRFSIDKNEIKAYPQNRIQGSQELTIGPGIRNILDYKTNRSFKTTLAFEQIKPGVRFVGKGTILPGSQGLILPFEAVSLKSVVVKITKIYENNMLQFLQVNNLDGTYELRRVGKPILKKVINLNASGVTDFGKWNRYSLDLAELIKTEPGAIYRVTLSFKKQHSTFYCGGETETAGDNLQEIEELETWDDAGSEDSYWDGSEEYYYGSDYNWQERDNPCHTSYYGSNREVSRSVFASDIGLIAKYSQNGELFIAASNINTTQPLSDVSLRVFDYQQQLIGEDLTNSMGQAIVKLKNKPFVLEASLNGKKAYLKLDDGNALSLSNFDVAGQSIQNGIKGFLYAERGVWRPGDSLHINFMLQDLDKTLPQNHPVIFELLNPAGQIMQRLVKSESVGGIYNFSTNTDAEAPTGNWLARVKVGGATFSQKVKIETIKPNRLKVKLDFGKEKLTSADKNLRGNLKVNWLHGAVAKNLKAEFEMDFTKGKTSFKGFEAYEFDDPGVEFESETNSIFEGYLDNNGEAIINANIEVDENAPGMLNAHFRGKVFEESGNFSVDRFSIPYYPYKSYVGLMTPAGDKARGMLLTDTTHQVQIINLSSEGKLSATNSSVKVKVYKLEWRWWWDQSTDNLSSYLSRSSITPLKEETVALRNGKGIFNLRVNYPEWGRYLVHVIDPVSGHSAGKVIYMDWPGWAGRASRKSPDGAAMLSFSSDKQSYKVGEEATISIPSSNQGRALVSIETGSKVVRADWVETQKGETNFKFTITDEMAPNVFVHVSLLQPHAQTVNDLPIRLYGVIPVQVDNPATHLQPKIKMPEVLAPESNFTVEVSEATGKPMAYTLAIVDEGLLDLTRFQTPDPWKTFYAREALGVKTWDMYDQVMGAFTGHLERILALGGDEANAKSKNSKANRFKPVVKFIGPFYLKKGSTNEHNIKLPPYVGSVRAMVVAANEGAYGQIEKAVPVRQAIMVLGTLPRVLGPEEEVRLPINVFAMENGIGNIEVEVKTNSLLKLVGDSKQTVYFKDADDKVLNFDLRVASATGIGKVEIIAKGGGKTATYKIELDVRNPNPPIVKLQQAIVEAGKSWNTSFAALGLAGTNTAKVEISSIPPININRRLDYLLHYPHGCLEQTVSKAFPQLYVMDVAELKEVQKVAVDNNIKGALERIKEFQLADGSFSYWPGNREVNDWASTYAGHFMVEAKNKGYRMPTNMYKQWLTYQKRSAKAWSSSTLKDNDFIQAYRLYTLALAGEAEMGAMNRLREIPSLSSRSKWRLAAAYALAGQPEAAQKLISQASMDSPVQYPDYTFGSELRDKAMILETLILLNQREKGMKLLDDVSKSLSADNYWMSTQTTAYCLLSASKFASTNSKKDGVEATYTINEDKVEVDVEKPIFQSDLKIKDRGANQIAIKNDNSGILFAQLTLQGIPAIGDTSALSSGLKMNVFYTDMEGNSIDPAQIEQGKDFIAEVSIKNISTRGTLNELALTQIFPSGWEIYNSRMDNIPAVSDSDASEYQDIRDDRVLTYFDLAPNQTKTFKVVLNASYAGRFYLPAVSCQAMYDNSTQARTPGKWVVVTKSVTQ